MKLSSRALILFVAKFMNLGISLLIGMVLARLLSKSAYGDYSQVWLVFQTISPLLIMDIDNSVMFFLPKLERSRHFGFLLQTIGVLALLGLLFSGLLYFGSSSISGLYGGGQTLNLYLRAFALYPVFYLPSLIAPLWLIATKRPMATAVMTTAFEFIRAVGTIVLVVTNNSLNVVFLWSGAAAIVNFLTMMWLIWRTYPGDECHFDWSLFRSQLGYSFPLAVSSVASTFLKRLSNNVVAMVYTAEIFAVYSNGAFEIPIIAPITNAVMLVLIPEFVQMDSVGKRSKILGLWLDSLRRLAFLVYPLAVFCFQFATPMMVLLYSEKYANSALVFQIFTLILPLRIAQYGSVLKALNRTSWILWNTLISLVVTLLLSIIFLRWLGITGPAWATVIGIYLMAGISLWQISRLLHVSFWQTYPWKQLFFTMLIALLSAIPTQFLILPRHWSAFVMLLVGSLVYGVTYFILALATRVLRRSDMDFVFEFARKLLSRKKKTAAV